MAVIAMAVCFSISNASISSSCSHTAWFGAEENSLSNSRKIVTFSLKDITVTSVTMSAALAPLGGGFNEALFLVGIAPIGSAPWNGTDLPDLSFGKASGYSSSFHGNNVQSSVLDSIILKSTMGMSANQTNSVSIHILAKNKMLFLDLAVAGNTPTVSDMEAQVEISYTSHC